MTTKLQRRGRKSDRWNCGRHPTTPLPPSRIKHNESVGCWRCSKEYKDRTRPLRAMKWDRGFMPCGRHPRRKCNRSFYVLNAARRCSSCRSLNADGELRGGYKRFRKKRNRSEEKRDYQHKYNQDPRKKKRQNMLARIRYWKKKKQRRRRSKTG